MQRAERHPLHDEQVARVVTNAAELLDRDAAGQQAAGPTVFGRQGQGEQAEVLEQVEHVLRILGIAVDGVGPRRDLFARNAPDEVLHGELVFGQGIH